LYSPQKFEAEPLLHLRKIHMFVEIPPRAMEQTGPKLLQEMLEMLNCLHSQRLTGA
jgi:hypothetical protein